MALLHCMICCHGVKHCWLTWFLLEYPVLPTLHTSLPSHMYKHLYCDPLAVYRILSVTHTHTPSHPHTHTPSHSHTQGRAMQLLAAGYRTPQDVATADPTTLSEQIEHMFPKNAKKLIHAAKVRPRMCSCTVNYCLSPLLSPLFPSPPLSLLPTQVLLADQAEALFEEAEELMSLAPQNSS